MRAGPQAPVQVPQQVEQVCWLWKRLRATVSNCHFAF